MIYTPTLWRYSFHTIPTKCNIKFCSTISSTSANIAQQNEQPLKLAFDQFKNEKTGTEETNPLVIVHGLFGQKNNCLHGAVTKALVLR